MEIKGNSRENKVRTIALFCTKEALNFQTSGASLRVSTLVRICTDLGFKVIVKESTVRNIRDVSDGSLLAFCSFASLWPMYFRKRQQKVIWVDSTDSVLLTLKSQVKNRMKFRSIFSSVRALVAVSLISKVDFLTYICERDAVADKKLRRRMDEKVFVLPNHIEPWNVRDSSTLRFIFMGSLDYDPNYQGLKSLLGFLEHENFKHLQRKIHVFGKNPSRLSSLFPEVNWHGYADYAPDLSDIHIAPIFAGAGVKNKVAIPVLSGVKVIATREAAIGIIKFPNLLICESLEEFILSMSREQESFQGQAFIYDHKEPIFEVDQTNNFKTQLREL